MTAEKPLPKLAENGKTALEMYEASEEGHYDVLILDVRMPVLGGRDAAEKIEASPITEMVISDSIPLSDAVRSKTSKITQLTIADMLAETIDAIQNHKSVSRVYDMYDNRLV